MQKTVWTTLMCAVLSLMGSRIASAQDNWAVNVPSPSVARFYGRPAASRCPRRPVMPPDWTITTSIGPVCCNDNNCLLLLMNHKERVNVAVRPHETHLDVYTPADHSDQ
jgi:hypothetical protein